MTRNLTLQLLETQNENIKLRRRMLNVNQQAMVSFSLILTTSHLLWHYLHTTFRPTLKTILPRSMPIFPPLLRVLVAKQ